MCSLYCVLIRCCFYTDIAYWYGVLLFRSCLDLRFWLFWQRGRISLANQVSLVKPIIKY
jgi:hypothetical protein